ncbi:MAG: hypothetical protein LBM98_11940 [Oscillospiraceae bacterium]|nr:hypothetical protein [Oscillospiraceae bacterium]
MTIIPLVITGVLIVGGFFLQIFLSERESKWPGLVLPFIQFCVSLAAIMLTVTKPEGFENDIFVKIITFLLCNIPTVILLAIYAACREKQKARKRLDKMNAQDLE